MTTSGTCSILASRGYFPNWDNHSIASVTDLERDDHLTRRGLDFSNHMNHHWDLFRTMVNYFNAESDWYDGSNAHFGNAKLFNTDCPVWDPRLDLRAGEKLTLRWDNQGKWWNREDLCSRWNKLHSPGENDNWTAPPLVYSNGTLEFRPDLSKLKEQAFAADGILASGGAIRRAPPRQVVVRFYDGQPMDGHLDEKLIGESVIPSIAPGEFGVARVEWKTTGLSGRHWVYAVVDPLDQIPEI